MSGSRVLHDGFDSKEAEELRQGSRITANEETERALHKRTLLEQHNNTKYSHSKYRETHMLLIHFEFESFDLMNGLYKFKSVLERSYAIVCRLIAIPRAGSSRFLHREIRTFIHCFSAPDILLLMYYAGYANRAEEGAGITLGFIGNIDWFECHQLLDNCLSDVLIFLELGSQSLNVRNALSFTQQELAKNRNALAGRTDVITTCGTGKMAPGEPYSLAVLLAWTLRGFAHKDDFTVADLHNALISRQFLPNNLQCDKNKFGEICFSKLHSPSRNRDIRIMPFKLKGGLYSYSSDSRHASFLQPYGPLGRPPLEWETRMDGYSRVHAENRSFITYSTRPWRSLGNSCATELWQPKRFADRCQLDAYGVFRVSFGLEIFTRNHLEVLEKDHRRNYRTAMDAYAEWIAEFEVDEDNHDWMDEFMELLDEEAVENPEVIWPFKTSMLP